MKKQLAMVIDSSKCVDCKACVVACKVEHKVPTGFSRNWIKVEQPYFSDPDWMTKNTQSHFQPGGCMHCDNPTCVEVCPTGATYKNAADGSIKVDDDLCIGCGSCQPACPYGARYLHPKKQIVDKCDFCDERREKGSQPTCVETCPTQARVFGDLNDANSKAALLNQKYKTVQLVSQNINTNPNMYYINETFPKHWPSDVKFTAPISLWQKAGNPLVWAATGVNAMVVLAMLGRQFLDRKDKVALENSSQKEAHND